MSWARSLPVGNLTVQVRSWRPDREAPDESVDYIDLSCVGQRSKRVEQSQSYLGSDVPSRARQKVEKGDVLVSTVRPNLNAVAVVPPALDGATASTGFCVLRPSSSLDGGYLFRWLTGRAFIDEMVRNASGASYPAVSDRIVKAAMIPLPPLDEQRRIADVLDRADALRAKRRETLARVDELTQSIFVDMFGDVASNSAGWPTGVCLADVADVGSGITKGRRLPVAVPTAAVPYMAVANVQERRLALTTVKEIEATPAEIERYALKRNDLLLTEGGDPDKLGRGTLWRAELPLCIFQNHIFRVRVSDPSRIRPFFLMWLVGSSRGKRYFLRAAKQTTGIASINTTQLRAFPLVLPPLDLQVEFEDRLERVEQARSDAASHLAALDELFASLQQRAFRGDLFDSPLPAELADVA